MTIILLGRAGGGGGTPPTAISPPYLAYPSKPMQLQVTGAEEEEYLVQVGVAPENLLFVKDERNKLRRHHKKKLRNAANYQNNKDQRLERARENNKRHRQNFCLLSEAQQNDIIEGRQLSHWKYRRANRQLLAQKERERRAQKKAQRLILQAQKDTS
ncbi:hypothetical protein K435DRAFT_851879 [Dendrothele bispora CBS 962.96]|uniref:Uncharacterized protein n=1 Tax=Dendrothele bispora (strain CBS 962.96) TaxID=1314807 RepID=A0A4S8MMD3_DENBC|nr:hypothetical protein K435DRAFT_851879 [Dendrothele bispora CBS 962.96]